MGILIPVATNFSLAKLKAVIYQTTVGSDAEKTHMSGPTVSVRANISELPKLKFGTDNVPAEIRSMLWFLLRLNYVVVSGNYPVWGTGPLSWNVKNSGLEGPETGIFS